MITDFTYYFLLSIIGIVWFYFIGVLLMKLLKISIPLIQLNTLLSLLIGIVSHVIVFSIFKTHFATLNVILLLILLAVWIEFRKYNKFIPIHRVFKVHLLQLTELALVGLLLYVIKIFLTVDPKIYPVFNSGRDDIFYSQMSGFISTYGKENFYIDWVSDVKSLGIVPYHYFELWLNAFLSEITGLLNLLVYTFTTFVIITLLLYKTILAMMEVVLKQKITIKHIITAISLLFMGDIFFGLVHKDTWTTLTGGYALFDNFKIILIFIVFVLSWITWKKEYYTISLLLLLISPLLNFGLMPIIMGVVPVFFVVHYRIIKTGEEIQYKKILYYYLIYILLLIGIQKVFSNQFNGLTTLSLKDLINYYNELSKVKTFLNYVLIYILDIGMLFLTYFFILIPLKQKGLLILKSGFNVLMLLILISSIVLSSLLHFLMDTSQLFTIITNIIAHLLLFAGIPMVLFLIQRNYFYKGLIIMFLIAGGYFWGSRFSQKGAQLDRYSPEFLKQVQKISYKIHGQGIRFLTPDYYHSTYNINPNCNFEGYYLSYFKNNLTIHTVSVNNIPDKKELHDFFNYNKKIILRSSYYLHFVDLNGLQNVSDDSAQYAFVKNNNIDFIVTTKNAVVPENIKKMVIETVEDSTSKETLMLIDRKKLLK